MLTTQPEPKLAPPGAGLPRVELLVARALFRVQVWTGSRRSFEKRFGQERERIRELIQNCDPELGARRVLIRRIAGLEDSSRNWSVWMTLDHLRIVNHSIAEVIRALVKGAMPEGTASTAAVKPSETVTADILTAYEESCDVLRRVVAQSADLNTQIRFRHPWFGPLNAYRWLVISAVHMRIHRAQIERILAGLRSEATSRPA